MHSHSFFGRRARPTLVLAAFVGLAIAALHCGRDEESVPVGSQFGRGGSSGNGVAPRLPDLDGGTSGSGTTSGSPDDGFDPLADGGYWSGYDAGEDGVTEDGGINGGPNLYELFPSCPVVKVESFQLDGTTNEAAAYGAAYTPAVEGSTNRLNLIVASPTPFSYLGPFFPLGFRDPPRVLDPANALPVVGTYPFPDCKRCLSVPTGETDTQFIAIGGMLSMAPAGNPMGGTIVARADLVVLVEATKAGGGNYRPIPGGKCIRVLSAPIVVQ